MGFVMVYAKFFSSAALKYTLPKGELGEMSDHQAD